MKTIDECYHCVSYFVGYLNITFVTFVSRGLVKVSKSYDETYIIFYVNLFTVKTCFACLFQFVIFIHIVTVNCWRESTTKDFCS